MSIRVEHVTFQYGAKTALNDVNFALQAGQFSALLGPNGAGKSTLFALLTRLYTLQQGSILLQDLSLKTAPAAVMQKIGVVFQQSTLDLDLSVQQNLSYHAALHGLSGTLAKTRITQELERMQLTERAHERVRSLNGGHRRRVEIARALLHKPDVLLLDEPTTGLDPQTRQKLNQHVRALCADSQLTVLWATHLIEEIHPDDRVLLLHKGQLLADATGTALCDQYQQADLAGVFHHLTQDAG